MIPLSWSGYQSVCDKILALTRYGDKPHFETVSRPSQTPLDHDKRHVEKALASKSRVPRKNYRSINYCPDTVQATYQIPDVHRWPWPGWRIAPRGKKMTWLLSRAETTSLRLPSTFQKCSEYLSRGLTFGPLSTTYLIGVWAFASSSR